MEEFSLENSIEKIYNSKTKLYFQEVFKSYCSNSFRSATVMLYSVVLSDLIYKLKDLRDIYNDKTSKEILEEINGIRNKNKKLSAWEDKLLEIINERTSFFEDSDYTNIIHLQKHRHLSAHPVINDSDLLFSPSKDDVRAHIRNMLIGVLTKPPLFSKNIFSEIVDDLKRNKDLFLENKLFELKKYLKSKYLSNLSDSVKLSIFKSFWKFVFSISNNDANDNRQINFKVFNILFDEYRELFKDFIKTESSYFSSISRGVHIDYLILFLSKNSDIYNYLDDSAKELIKAESGKERNLYVLSWFTKNNFKAHINDIKLYIDEDFEFVLYSNTFKILFEVGVEHDCFEDVLDLGMYVFSKSYNYSLADIRFNVFICNYLYKFNKENFIKLFEIIEENDQILGRRQMVEDSFKIMTYAKKVLGQEFDYNGYPKFMESYNYYIENKSKADQAENI